MSPAGYWWSRLAAAVVVRLCHYLVAGRWPLEVLLFVDDVLFNAKRAQEIIDVGVLLLILEALGVPFKWTKFRGGIATDWIGYRVNWETRELGISPKRSAWLVGWMRREVATDKTNLKDFSGVLGRLGFA